MKKEKVVLTPEQNEEYLLKIFSIAKKMENISLVDRNTCLNDSELRMLGEIFMAKREGKRLISTQLADRLNITRSAISQMVNKLEKDGIVQRVPDAVDRKIAYVELTDEAKALYLEDMKVYEPFMERVVSKYGVERFHELCKLMDSFYELMKEEKKKL